MSFSYRTDDSSADPADYRAEGGGRARVRTTARLIAAHDLVHRRQIDRILEAVG